MRHLLTLSVLLLVPMFFLWGCDNDTTNGDVGGGGPEIKDGTCIGCHSSEELLQAALASVAGSKVLVPNKGDG